MAPPMTPRRVLAWAALWLACVWAVALLASVTVPWLTGPRGWSPEFARRVTPLTRWDSGWYVGIAENGYQSPPTDVGQEG